MPKVREESLEKALGAEILLCLVQGRRMAKEEGITGARWCLYCGFQATGRDHVIPFSLQSPKVFHRRQRRYRGEGPLVLACFECNSLLGARIFHKFCLRLEFLIEKYNKRLGKSDVDYLWSEEEIEEMGEAMRRDIHGAIRKAEVYRAKLLWLRKLTAMLQERAATP